MKLNLPALWHALRIMFTRMQSAVGAHIAKEELCRIRAWIAPVIAMFRKVVLLEALALLDRGSSDPQLPRASTAAGLKTRGPRTPSIRLWPQPKRKGPRIRQLGPPVLVRDVWRENARAAAADRLKLARLNGAPPLTALTRRIHALARLMDDPRAAIRRLARKLRANRTFALVLGVKRMPRTRLFDVPEYRDAYAFGFNLAVAHACPDTS